MLAIVGESGSGKSTTAMSILGLLPKNSHVEGSIKLGDRELVGQSERMMRGIRGKDVAMIFQEPMTALNPVYTIGFQIAEMLRTHQAMAPKAARTRAIELLTLVEIPEPERRVDAYPHQLSGGQRQRAMIAQALALDPVLLVADEPTTALDVTVQAEILKLMRDLKHRVDAVDHPDHPRHGCGCRHGRPHHRDEGRQDRRDRRCREDLPAPRAAVHDPLLEAVPHLGAVVAEEGVVVAEDLADDVGGAVTDPAAGRHVPGHGRHIPGEGRAGHRRSDQRADLAPGVSAGRRAGTTSRSSIRNRVVPRRSGR